ncbi:plasmid replication protein RepC-20 (plasmid) [Sulfitobacter sp. DSM 110093]|uniref:helix-turn-helix domain-containing protein n=1 Tax=Sulfitobacter sp. DSM 110093 TaxID=2883127 RepID=UPI001FACAF06|nr:helix-turn-helix domain-containing protein [Sulfitobacter sp. DSM 110093]UOA33571.1 plasmid replication protein RepC-20 [Sulfitobacter sp. DSM 110093]
MKQAKITASHVGDRRSYAPTLPERMQPVTRRDLMTAVKSSSPSYGLTPSSILVLETLLSFLPCRDRSKGMETPLSSDALLVVYPSNKTICERANRMGDRVLRRHIAKLCEIGFITRKDSATGKRFPLRVGGVVRDAFGFDLSPLLHLYPELVAEAARLDLEAEELRSMRSEALAIRADLLRAPEQLAAVQIEYLTQVKTILRRSSLKTGEVAALMQEMRALKPADQAARPAPEAHNEISRVLNGGPCPSPAAADQMCRAENKESERQKADPGTQPVSDESTIKLNATQPIVLPRRKLKVRREAHPQSDIADTRPESGRNGQNVRQVESIKLDPNKKAPDEYSRLTEAWEHCPNIASLYPDAVQSPSRLREAVFLFGSFLSLKGEAMAKGVASIGWPNMLRALEYLAENAMRIKSPAAYFTSMIEGFIAGKPVAGMR